MSRQWEDSIRYCSYYDTEHVRELGYIQTVSDKPDAAWMAYMPGMDKPLVLGGQATKAEAKATLEQFVLFEGQFEIPTINLDHPTPDPTPET